MNCFWRFLFIVVSLPATAQQLTREEIATELQKLATDASVLSTQAAALAAQVRTLPAPRPTPTPDPDAALARPVFRPDRLEYLGSARLPASVDGFTTAYGSGTLTHRYVGDKLRFFSTVHWGPALGNSGVFEFELPPLLGKTIPSTSDCRVVKWWGDVYGGLKELNPKPAICHCLKYVRDPDTLEEMLFWTFGPEYSDSATQLRESIGVTMLSPATDPPFVGTWRANCSAQFTRGGVTPIPSWFAPFVGGRAYALGFGGYFSVHEGGWGPCLLPCDNPDWSTAEVMGRLQLRAGAVEFTDMLRYPPKLRAPRSPDNRSPVGDETAAGGPDHWLWTDELGGDTGASSFVWFNLHDVRGAVFFPSMGTGLCQYDQQLRWITSEGRKIACYVYDEKDLIRAANGEIKSSDVPVHFEDFPTPLFGSNPAPRFGGFTLDETTRTLYGLEYHAIPGRTLSSDQVEPRHVVHAWRVR